MCSTFFWNYEFFPQLLQIYFESPCHKHTADCPIPLVHVPGMHLKIRLRDSSDPGGFDKRPIRLPKLFDKAVKGNLLAVETACRPTPGSNLALISWGSPVHCLVGSGWWRPLLCQAFKCTIECSQTGRRYRFFQRQESRIDSAAFPWGQTTPRNIHTLPLINVPMHCYRRLP